MAKRTERLPLSSEAQAFKPEYKRWRHGGWYVTNLRHSSGAVGCVSNNYPDKKWRIACDDRRTEIGGEGDFTFESRDAAARGEYALIEERAKQIEKGELRGTCSTEAEQDSGPSL